MMSEIYELARPVSREEFVAAWHTHRDNGKDKFAGTFIAKADMLSLWEEALGYYSPHNGELLGAIAVRLSQRKPVVANLQLLHTFSPFRRVGVAGYLVMAEYERVRREAAYFRVSSEPEALPFYRSIGFRFWGLQKSGTALSIFRISGPTISGGVYDAEDNIIQRAVFSKQRGGVVELYGGGPQ